MTQPGSLSRRLFYPAFLILCLVTGSAQEICGVRGTAPFCAGSCETGERLDERVESNCWTGSKAVCCVPEIRPTPGRCRWRGTAPFCAGSCPLGEFEQISARRIEFVSEPLDAELLRGFGQSCWTGTKVLCCTASAVEPLISPSVSDGSQWKIDSAGVCRDSAGQYPRWSAYNWPLQQCEEACKANPNCQGFAMSKTRDYCQLFGSDGSNEASRRGTQILRGDSSQPDYTCYIKQ